MSQKSEGFDEYDDSDNESRTRECNEQCGHYDSLNCCCWIASEKGLCRDVGEGDLCLYGFKEDDFK
jgi:hypothetical protein